MNVAVDPGSIPGISTTLNWPLEEKPRGSSSKGRKMEKVALYISIGKAWR
jgi:hypothetical protein